MQKIDIFKDNEFQSLDLEQKKEITTNYFNSEIADDEFRELPDTEQEDILNNFTNSQLDFDVSDTFDKGVEYLKSTLDKNQEVNLDGMDEFGVQDEKIQKEHTATTNDITTTDTKKIDDPFETINKTFTQNEDTTSTMTPDEIKESKEAAATKDYVNPEAQEWELAKRVVNTTNELTSNAIQATYNFLGDIKSPAEYLGFENDSTKATNKARKDWFKKASDDLNDFVYEENKFAINGKGKPTHSWDEVKKGFKTGGVFDVDAWQELGNYVGSEGVNSLPHMAEMVSMMPLYFASMLQKSAEESAKNDNLKEPTINHYATVAPFVAGYVFLDRLGLKGITSDVVQGVGKQAIDGTLKSTLGTISKEMGKGTLKEAGTEGVQTLLEKSGEEVLSQKGFSSIGEYVDETFAAMVAGGGMGAGMSGTTATGSQVFNEYSNAKREAQKEDYIQDSYNKQMMGSGYIATVDDAGYVEFKNNLDKKVSAIQTDFENLIINNPDVAVPVTAINDVDAQEEVVLSAIDAGLDISDNNGLNAIDAGFKKLEAEIGGVDDIVPTGAEATELGSNESITLGIQALSDTELQEKIDKNTQKVQSEEPSPFSDNFLPKLLTEQERRSSEKEEEPTAEPIKQKEPVIDTARLNELQEKPDDELTTDEQFELEDLQEEVRQLKELGNDETMSDEKALVEEYDTAPIEEVTLNQNSWHDIPNTLDVKITNSDRANQLSVDELNKKQDGYYYSTKTEQNENGTYSTIQRKLASEEEKVEQSKDALVDRKYQYIFDNGTIKDGYLKTKSLYKDEFKDFTNYLQDNKLGTYEQKKGFRIDNPAVIEMFSNPQEQVDDNAKSNNKTTNEKVIAATNLYEDDSPDLQAQNIGTFEENKKVTYTVRDKEPVEATILPATEQEQYGRGMVGIELSNGSKRGVPPSKLGYIQEPVAITSEEIKAPTIDEARDKARESKKGTPSHISEQLTLNEKLYGDDETKLAEENAKLFQKNKSEEARLKNLNADDRAELDKQHFQNTFSELEINRAYDFLPTATKQTNAQQGSLAFEGTQQQLFDTKGSEEYVVPSWAKGLISDTVRYDDIIKAVSDAKNGNPTELSSRVMQALHKVGNPHLEKDIKRYDELITRWDLNELEEAESIELSRLLAKHLDGEEDGTYTRAETRTTQDEATDNGAIQEATEQGVQSKRSESESDRSVPDSDPFKSIVFDTEKVYDTKGVMDETPTRTLSKTIQKDVARYVGQLADRLGFEFELDKKGKKLSFNGVNKNIAPVGGSMSFSLFKPDSDVGIYVSLDYDTSMTQDGSYDTYFLGADMLGGHLYRTVTKDGKSGGNHFIKSDELTSEKFVTTIKNMVDREIENSKVKNDIIEKEEVNGDEKLSTIERLEAKIKDVDRSLLDIGFDPKKVSIKVSSQRRYNDKSFYWTEAYYGKDIIKSYNIDPYESGLSSQEQEIVKSSNLLLAKMKLLEENSINKEEVQDNEESNRETAKDDGRDILQTVSTVDDGASEGQHRGVQSDSMGGTTSRGEEQSTTQVPDATSEQSNPDDGRADNVGVQSQRSETRSGESISLPVQQLEDNFKIEDELGEGGAKTKFKNNIEAIKIVQKIQTQNYKPTVQEKKTLSKYVGWGGIPNAFIKPDGSMAKGWEKEAAQLKELLSDDQYAEARRSTQDAHYTSKEVVDAIWSGVKQFGFKGGKVLEPSVGVGNFFGMMPSSFRNSTKLYGVELDGITATIAQALYPKATIQNKGFQDVELSRDFSLVIGNPPFGSQKLFDKNSKHLKDMSIHNYFFAKGIDSLQEGGIMAMVVSNGLMDAGNSKAREYIGSQANLLGAIRLPNNAFSKNANTEVTTDIIFLQKRYKGEESNIDTWKDIGEINDTPINEYFVNNESMMLGKWGKYGSMYRGDMPALIPHEDKTAAMLLPDALDSLPKNVITHETIIKENVSEPTFNGDLSKVRIGAMYVSDGVVYKRELDRDGEPQATEVKTKLNSKNETVEYKPNELAKIKAMIEVVSVADELRVLQLDTRATEAQISQARKNLNKSYDAFVKKHKFLNNATNKSLFADDVRSPFLLALEKHYDKGVSAAVAKKSGELPKKESAVKADIFTKRTQTPYTKPKKAQSEQDALTISLSEYGNINLVYMQELTGKTEEELIKALDGFMYDDVDAGWVTKEEYLSGNVKAKYELTDNPKYKKALQEVIPKDIEAMDISVTLGSSWIPKDVMADFVEHITGDDNAKITLTSYNAKWGVQASVSSAKASQWGTKRRDASTILEQTMNLVQMQVKDNHGTSAQPQWVVNTDDTTEVQEKQELLKAEFKEWIWKTKERRDELSEIYNREFNTKALREYDGSHINFVGKSNMIDLRQHQKNGVWRMLQGGTTLFDHTVGTGKTFTAIAGIMELRRTGKANKPLVVVPNHLTSQWGKEWMELYPNANILVPTKADFSAARRKLLMSKIATGDYDAIVIAHSQLTTIQNDPEFEKSFIEDEISRIQSAIDTLKAEDGKERSVKQAEDSKEKLENKLKALNDMNRDDNLNFAELGIDAILVDEAHEFKNLNYTTGLQGVAGLGNPKGSKKAFDLFIKTQNILDKTNGNNVVFLTGTPISNTIAEMFTIQRYLDYQGLKDKNLDIFDAWVKQYAEVVSDWELSPSGKYKLNTRLSKFNNMPELITEYKQFADVVTREDIPALPIPKIKGGRAENVVVERSDAQAAYIGVEDRNGRYPEGSLVYRSENLPKGKPKKGADNMLSIMGEARKVALDMRLIDPSYADNPDSKVNLTVDNTFEIYKKWNDKKGTQLIFCDLSTPKGAVAKEKARIEELIKKSESEDAAVSEKAQEELDKMSPDEFDALNSQFSVYDDIKAKLIAKGMKEDEIAFIHDANTDLQKQELFAKVKSGKVRVLLGSTSKMGAGMNVQDKLIALHHIDVPWRPSDLEQREGRIIRQGNEFFKADPDGFEVEIFRYATKNTLDSMMWQTIEAKANFIEQLRAGNLLDREVDDVSGEAMNAAEMKAASSGNPLILESMVLKKDIKKLEALKKSHDRNQYDLEDKIRKAEALINESDKVLKDYAKDAAVAKKLPKKFSIDINKKVYDDREKAGEEIINIMLKTPARTSKLIGEIGGFSVYVETTGKGLALSDTGIVTLSGTQDYEFSFNMEDQSYSGLTLKIENTIKKISDEMQKYEMSVEYATEQLPQFNEQVKEFKDTEKLDAMRVRQKEVMAELKKKPDDKEQDAEADVETENDTQTDSFMKAPVKNQTPKEIADTETTNNYARANGYDEAGINYIPTYKVNGLPHRPDDGTIMLGNREVILPTSKEPMNADTIRVELSDIIGNRLYQAKLRNKSALGKYQRRDSAIRVKSYSDVEVMAHEMAHYLDYFYKNSTKKAPESFFRKEILKNKEEVKALSYTTDKKLVVSEGFAEFVRLWMTNYNSLNLVAPNMVKDFEAKLSKDKEFSKKMYQLQESMHKFYYQGAGVAKYVGGDISSTAKKIQRSQAQIAKEYRQKTIDRIHSIKRIEAEIKGDVSADARESAYKSLQLVNGHSSIMYSAMNIGVPTVLENGDISYSGKSLNDIFAPVTSVSEDRVKLMENYFVARRANELMEQGRENLITQEDINADLKLADAYPEFKTIFEEYQEFNNAMLDFYVEMRLITSEQRENFLEMNKDYVPFHRINESVQYDGAATSKIGQRLTGGTSSLNDIMENIINGLENNIKEALISRGKSMFYEMLEDSGMGGVYATRVPTENKVVKDNIKAQAKKVATVMAMMDIAVSKDGMIISGKSDATDIYSVEEIEDNLLLNPKTLEVWTHGHPPTSADGYIDSAIINDRVVYFETKDIGLIDAMTSFSGSHYGSVVRGLMWMKNVITWNITNNPLFYFTNFARDTVSASVLSKNGFKPLASSVNGMYHFITRSKTYKEFMASGAGYGTRRTSLGGDIEAMKMLNVKRSLSVLDKLIGGFEYGADMFEYGTRIGEFALAKEAGKSSAQAAFEAREISTDFAIKGSNKTISGAMATVPFMKAGILGIDKTARRIFSLNGEMKVSNALKFKNQMGELQSQKIKIYAMGGMIAGATLALWFQNKDDERYKRLTRDEKMMYWNFFVGDKHIKVPRPYDIGFIFSTIPEIIADGIHKEKGADAAKDFAWGVKNMFSMGDISGLFQPILEHMTNTNWTGSPIVPTRMQNLDDLSDQYMNSTPLLYKEFGELTGASPIMTKHYVNGYLGLTARMIEEAAENMLWNTKEWGARPFSKNPAEFMVSRFVGKEEPARTLYSEKYYELVQKASAVKNSLDVKKKKAFIDGGKDVTEYMSDEKKQSQVQISKALTSYSKELAKIKNQVEHIIYDKKLSQSQKEKEINKAYETRTAAFKNIVENVEAAIEKLEDKK